MEILVDDVGSFPLPDSLNRESFSMAYRQAREAIVKGEDYRKDPFIEENFCRVTLESFKQKLRTGLDIVNYPQQYDGMKQVGDAIHKTMETGTFTVEDRNAFFPEVHLIATEAKNLSEEFEKKILLRVSMFGPMELYLKEVGTIPYLDVLEGYSETIRRFAKNSVIDNKYIKTQVVSIDEPSFGFLNITAGSADLCSILDKAFNFQGATKQIHLHSAARLPDLFCVKNLDVLSFEYAASPKNVESVSKQMLENADKHVRVGIARTDIDSILAELNDKGIAKPTPDQLVENEEAIKKRYLCAKKRFGERMTFTGPDCGLGSWPTQESAQLLLQRTVAAVKAAQA